MMRSVSEALPKTYHQPIGPAAPRGMGWGSTGRMRDRTPSRASSHRPTEPNSRLTIGPSLPLRQVALGVLQGRVMGGPDLELAIADPPDAGEQPTGGRPRGALTVGV